MLIGIGSPPALMVIVCLFPVVVVSEDCIDEPPDDIIDVIDEPPEDIIVYDGNSEPIFIIPVVIEIPEVICGGDSDRIFLVSIGAGAPSIGNPA
jgi:hypothetical protein